MISIITLKAMVGGRLQYVPYENTIFIILHSVFHNKSVMLKNKKVYPYILSFKHYFVFLLVFVRELFLQYINPQSSMADVSPPREAAGLRAWPVLECLLPACPVPSFVYVCILLDYL